MQSARRGVEGAPRGCPGAHDVERGGVNRGVQAEVGGLHHQKVRNPLRLPAVVRSSLRQHARANSQAEIYNQNLVKENEMMQILMLQIN